MKKWFAGLFVIGLLAFWQRGQLATPVAGESGARLFLIGVDGASWNVLDPLLEDGQLPHFKELIERGVTANLRSVDPVISPSVWTTVATGRTPQDHGVLFFGETRESIAFPTVFDLWAAKGLKVGLYDYMLTWPPKNYPNGFVIPGWLRRDATITPQNAYERAGIPPYAYEVAPLEGSEDVLNHCQREMEEKAKTFNSLVQAFQPDVTAVTFYALDAISHRFWHSSFPLEGIPPYEDPRSHDLVRKTARSMDKALGEVVGQLSPNDMVVLVSDHGFEAMAEPSRFWAYNHEKLLAAGGFDIAESGLENRKAWRRLGWLLHEGEEEERAQLAQSMVDFLGGMRTSDGESLFDTHIIRFPLSKKYMAQLDIPERPLKNMWRTMVKSEGYGFVWALPRPDALRKAFDENRAYFGQKSFPVQELWQPIEFTGDHTKDGVLIAAGGPIQAQTNRLSLSVLDVAPLLLYLSNMRIPENFERDVPKQLLSDLQLFLRPTRQGPALPKLEAGEGNGEVNDELAERLRSLGYIQ